LLLFHLGDLPDLVNLEDPVDLWLLPDLGLRLLRLLQVGLLLPALPEGQLDLWLRLLLFHPEVLPDLVNLVALGDLWLLPDLVGLWLPLFLSDLPGLLLLEDLVVQ
jgi:hypothetical protein